MSDDRVRTPPRIADAHVHFWDLQLHDYPFMRVRRDYETFAGDTSSAFRTFLPPDLRAAAAGLNLEKVVHVEAHLGTDDPADETRWLQALAERDGAPDGIVGYAALHRPGVQAVLEAHAASPGFRGVRHSLNWHPDRFYSMCDRPDYMDDAAWRAGYGLLARFGLSFDLQIFPHQLDDAARLATDFPDTPLILEHCAFPIDRTPEGLSSWRAGLERLAERPNTTVKLSALTVMDHRWTRESLAPIIQRTVDVFGPDRTLFASNFPIDRVYTSYPDCVAAVSAALTGLDEDELDGIFHRTATRVYKL